MKPKVRQIWRFLICVHSTVGQEPGNYFHRPSSGLEKGSPSIPDFYRPDELKYHGKRNRGVVTMNFYDEIKRSIGDNAGATLDFCGGEWKYPRYEFDLNSWKNNLTWAVRNSQ